MRKFFYNPLCGICTSNRRKAIHEYKAAEQRRHDHKINRTNALATTQKMLIGLFVRKQYQKVIDAFDDVVDKKGRLFAKTEKNQEDTNRKNLTQ